MINSVNRTAQTANRAAQTSKAVRPQAAADVKAPGLNGVLRDAANRVDPPKKNQIDADLVMDVTQIGLDVVGIFDPTPVSDGANALISLGRGDLVGAGLSAVSMVPLIGDAAKLGKLGKWAQTIAKAVDAAATNPAMRAALSEAMGKLGKGLNAVPASMLKKLPNDAQKAIADMKASLKRFDDAPRVADTAEAGAKSGLREVARQIGDNKVVWKTNADGHVVEARASLREVFPNLKRSADEVKAQDKVAARGIEGDHGGHIIGHRFVKDQGDINMFPQNGVGIDGLKNFNGSAYKTMENEIADWIKAGAEVDLTVKLGKLDDMGRPGTVTVRYSVIDPATNKVIYKNRKPFLNEAGQEFSRISSADIAQRVNGGGK